MIPVEERLNVTEQCLLQVINEPRFSAIDKSRLLISYAPVISDFALNFLIERANFIEHLKEFYKN